MKRNHKGFSAVEVLLFLILIAILGFTGYYVWHTRKNANTNYDNASKVNDSVGASSPAAPKYTFKELGVQVVLPQALHDMTYTVENTNGVQYLDLSTPQFTQAINDCSDSKTTEADFASLDRKSGTFPSNPDVLNGDGQLLKQFDGFYIEASYPNGIGCDPNSSNAAKLTSVFSSDKAAVAEAFKSATPVK